LTIERVLAWADAHHAQHGAWPAVGPLSAAGEVPGAPGESWRAINHALVFGLRGLPGDSSLAELLSEHRDAPVPDMGPKALADKIWAWEQEQFPIKGPRRRRRQGQRQRQHTQTPTQPTHPPLTSTGILAWADAHHAATGKWPNAHSGPVCDAPSAETWRAIDQALRKGNRGLPGGSGLSRFLVAHRGVRNLRFPPQLSVEKILAWAENHHAAHGIWPGSRSGPVADAPDETWARIDRALSLGLRGLPGGTTVIGLLAAHGRCSTRSRRPRLTEDQILAWADAHRAATGRWPLRTTGAIAGTRDKWSDICNALRSGDRGLPKGSTLARLLARHRDVPNHLTRPKLSYDQILAWADAHFAASGRWPTTDLTPVTAAPGETWHGIQQALYHGRRGLPGGMSLARLLDAHRRTPRPPLTVATIRAWAVAHRRATGLWPTARCGAVAGAPGEYWNTIDKALRGGKRGLPGGTTLVQCMRAIPGKDNEPRRPRPTLTIEQVQAWVKAHHAATGQWPGSTSGAIPQAPGETWETINNALRFGSRGLPREKGLAALIRRAFDPTVGVAPDLSVDQILAWADAHRAATGRWPAAAAGAVSGAPGEKWTNINSALRNGSRGLAGGSSLSKLLALHRGVTSRRARLSRNDGA
jgi:hypothetical protein